MTEFSLKPAEKEGHWAWNGSDRSCFISLLDKEPVGKYIVRYPCNGLFNINKASVQVHFLAQSCQLEKDPPTHCFCTLLFCSAFTYAICDVCISWWPFQQFVVLILLAMWERWNSPRKATWTYGKVQFCSMQTDIHYCFSVLLTLFFSLVFLIFGGRGGLLLVLGGNFFFFLEEGFIINDSSKLGEKPQNLD